MAVANAKVTIGGISGALAQLESGVDNSQKVLEVYGTIAIDATPSTYAPGGLAIVSALNVALNGWAQEQVKASPLKTGDTGPTPFIVYVESVSGSGYTYQWNKATNKLQIFQGGAGASAPQAEIPTAAIPAAVSGDSLAFEARFVRK